MKTWAGWDLRMHILMSKQGDGKEQQLNDISKKLLTKRIIFQKNCKKVNK